MRQGRLQSDESHVIRSTPGLPVDFGFLTTQTGNDPGLARDLLRLFLRQAQRLVPRLPAMNPREQGETAHLLRGSCQGIGAWAAAEAAQRYEDAGPDGRAAAYLRLAEAFAEAETAIVARLASI